MSECACWLLNGADYFYLWSEPPKISFLVYTAIKEANSNLLSFFKPAFQTNSLTNPDQLPQSPGLVGLLFIRKTETEMLTSGCLGPSPLGAPGSCKNWLQKFTPVGVFLSWLPKPLCNAKKSEHVIFV